MEQTGLPCMLGRSYCQLQPPNSASTHTQVEVILLLLLGFLILLPFPRNSLMTTGMSPVCLVTKQVAFHGPLQKSVMDSHWNWISSSSMLLKKYNFFWVSFQHSALLAMKLCSTTIWWVCDLGKLQTERSCFRWMTYKGTVKPGMGFAL